MIEPHIFRCKDNIGDEGVQEDEDKPLKSLLLTYHLYVFQELTYMTEIKLSCRDLAKNFNKDIKLEGSIAVAPNESKSKTRKRSLDNSDDDKPRRNGSSKPNGKSRHNSDESEEESEEEEEEDEWAEVDEDMEPEALEKQKRIKLIKQHLLLLQEDSFKFLIGEGNRGMGEWSVNYKELGKTMRSIELEKIVEERFESTGTRLLRIIKDKGKLDEKQVTGLAIVYKVCILTSTDRQHSVT